jgi:hypothetical protein
MLFFLFGSFAYALLQTMVSFFLCPLLKKLKAHTHTHTHTHATTKKRKEKKRWVGFIYTPMRSIKAFVLRALPKEGLAPSP